MDHTSQSKNKLLDWMFRKYDLTIWCLQEADFSFKDTYRVKVKAWKKKYY